MLFAFRAQPVAKHLHQQHGHPAALPQGRRPRRRRPREDHQPPRPLDDRHPALQRQGPDDAVRAAGLARTRIAAVHPALREDHPAHADQGLHRRRLLRPQRPHHRGPPRPRRHHQRRRRRRRPWQFYDLGHGYCSYSFFEQCPHRMACARCDFYLPKHSGKAQLLEAKDNLQRMLVADPAHRRRARRRRRRPGRPRLPARPARRHARHQPAHATPARTAASATLLPIIDVRQAKTGQP